MFSPNNPAPIHLYAPDLSYGIEDDGSEFKQLFMALHSFKPSDAFQNSYESEVLSPTISRAGSGFTDSDSDEEVDIFAEDREDYDFEAHIPRPLLDTIRNMLDEPVPLPKESSLNPNATPFVPSSDASRVHALAASPNPHHRAPESNPQPLIYGYIPSLVYQPPPSSWTSIFADACVLPHTSPNTLSDHARDLVHSRLWNRDALAELAQHFCWKAFCPQETGRNVTPAGAARVVSKGTLAPFAVEVYRYLYLANDEETASSFLWLLKESVLGTFKATWHASESSKAISYRLSPTRSFIESGISLVSFIGDLFYVVSRTHRFHSIPHPTRTSLVLDLPTSRDHHHHKKRHPRRFSS
ncbi:hypothetical protein K435DRAFT_517995 [Dendrothele bispora CBS 962.96]|uniref:Uncharacterized protein n=1 Tax=Dendrothele bispora (strain CBS 962.96) TaxID=1314807 RepID=A0A4S8M9T9_DENBC|nr:hypothetical protein K435DRAFT_517995 [Dendrothele bispora CBS 962.96]